jgi:hypothetical protein
MSCEYTGDVYLRWNGSVANWYERHASVNLLNWHAPWFRPACEPGKPRCMGLPWRPLGFAWNTLSHGRDTVQGDQIFHSNVGLRVPQISLRSMNGLAGFIYPPRDEGTCVTRSSGRPGDVIRGALEQSTREMLHHGIQRRGLLVLKSLTGIRCPNQHI